MVNWELWRRDVETGQPLSMITGGLTEMEVAEALAVTNGQAAELSRYAVSDGVLTYPADVWLNMHPVANVKGVWHAGAVRAADVRQHELRSWWPALASALDRLEKDEVDGG